MRQSKCKCCGGLIYKAHPVPGDKTECNCSIWEYTKSGWQWLGITIKHEVGLFVNRLSEYVEYLVKKHRLPMISYPERVAELEAENVKLRAEIAALKGEPTLPLEEPKAEESADAN